MLIELPIQSVQEKPQPTNFKALTDTQWDTIKDLFPNPVKRGRGKPHTPWKAVMNSILFVLHIGGKWSALDKGADFASKSSAHRWFVLWEKTGFLSQLLETLQDNSDFSISFPPRRKRAASE